MFKNKKLYRKIAALWLVVFLTFNPMGMRLALAEEAGDTTVQPETTVTTEPAQIETGGAGAISETDTSVNTNQETIPGEISVPEDACAPPEGQTECPGTTAVSNTNEAELGNEAVSDAETGENTIEQAEDAAIDTGDAVAGVAMDNEVNTNVVGLEEAVEETQAVEEQIAIESAENTGTEPPNPELTVQNENLAEVDNAATASAETGENTASNNEGDVVIHTGDALAWVNLLNFINTNIVGSRFEFVFLDLLQAQILETQGEVNLNEVWRNILNQKGTGSLEGVAESEYAQVEILVQNFNQAVLENQVTVTAQTGDNEANGNSDASIATGDAVALANILNFVNTNILSSEFLFFVINILGVFDGDLVLPRAENFNGASLDGADGSETALNSAVLNNQNTAQIDNQLTTEASTGGNEALDNEGAEIDTGNATAISNSLSFVNWNIWANDWLILIINVLNEWTGNILGWSTPSAVEEASQGNQTLGAGQDNSGSTGGTGGPGLTVFENQNEAVVNNTINTSASTGNNQANGNQGWVKIASGNAFSLTNLMNFVNLNIMGGRWMVGIINVVGSWTGNLVFAYPDVLVELSNGSGRAAVGETTTYTLSYQNQGYDLATDVAVNFQLPEGFDYLSDSSGLTPTVSGTVYSWFLGSLERGAGGSFTIQVQVRPDFDFSPELSFWEKLIPQAHAAEGGQEKEVMAAAAIGTADPESNTNNNLVSLKTLVYMLPANQTESSNENEVDQRQPILEVTAKNNVNEFVYPGDVVTFEITVSNLGEVAVQDVSLTQKLYNGLPDQDFGTVYLELGRIEAKKGIKINFGLKLANNELVQTGNYHTLAWAQGLAPNGNQVSSNQARTDFQIKLKYSPIAVEAAKKEEGILGETSACPETTDILPYILLFLLSSAYLVSWTRPRLAALKNEKKS
jgi:uncharacterized repeat protein (TIGR01451 family)